MEVGVNDLYIVFGDRSILRGRTLAIFVLEFFLEAYNKNVKSTCCAQCKFVELNFFPSLFLGKKIHPKKWDEKLPN